MPYITGVETALSAYYRAAPSVYNRTSKGVYPVSENETVTITGFNLTDCESYIGDEYVGSTSINIGEVAKSGELTLTVNGVEALNNKNDNDASGSYKENLTGENAEYGYNRMPNGVNNNNLTDDVKFDIWEFKNVANPVNGGAEYVTMKISPATGRPGFSYANSILYFNMPAYASDQADSGNGTAAPANNTTTGDIYSQIPVGMNYGGFSHSTFCFDKNGMPYGVAMSTDTDSAGKSAFLQFFSREAPLIPSRMNQQMNYHGSINASRIEASTVEVYEREDGDYSGWMTDINRIQSIGMEASVTNNYTYIFMAYYDSLVKQVRFRWGTVGARPHDIDGTRNADNNGYNRNSVTAYGLHDIVDGNSYTGTYQAADYNGTYLRPEYPTDSLLQYGTANRNYGVQKIAATGITDAKDDYASPTDTFKAGKYVSLTIVNKDTANPVPVVAWYDEVQRKLCMAYNANPTGSNTWVTKEIDSDAGLYVKIAADKTGAIHFAYYNSAGSDLKYAYLSGLNDTEADIVMVDSFLSVGAKPTIDVVKNGTSWVPYIGYQMNGNLGTPAAAKIAYPVGSNVLAGVDNKDCFTGDWEVSVVPTKNIPKDDLINVGLHKNADGEIQNFTTTEKEDDIPNTIIQNQTLNVCSPSIVYGNKTQNPVVGYGIDTGAIEMGQKK